MAGRQTKLDLKSAYWQFLMDQASIEKTAFSPGPGYGLWEFVVMLYGLTGATHLPMWSRWTIQWVPWLCWQLCWWHNHIFRWYGLPHNRPEVGSMTWGGFNSGSYLFIWGSPRKYPGPIIFCSIYKWSIYPTAYSFLVHLSMLMIPNAWDIEVVLIKNWIEFPSKRLKQPLPMGHNVWFILQFQQIWTLAILGKELLNYTSYFIHCHRW